MNRGSLSHRQMQVLRLRARGMRTKEIAYELGISAQTVKNHITLSYAALGAESLAECFIALGWLTIPQEDAA